MHIYGISIWGVLLTVLLTGVSLGLFWVIDRRTFTRSLKALTSIAVQLALASVYVWGLYRLDNWFINILWLLLMAAITGYVCIGRNRLPWQKFLPVITVAVFAGCLVTGGCLLLAVTEPSAKRLFVPVMALLVGGLYSSTMLALRAYIISLRYTKIHRMYIQANGGTHLESLVPSIRRAFRAALLPQLKNMTSPLLLALPMLLCGMLIGGANVSTALTATLLVAMAGYASTVLTTAMTLWLSDRYLFDVHGSFIV